jgi:hypothetical protein
VKHRKHGRRRAPENKAHGPVTRWGVAPEVKSDVSLEAMTTFADGFKEYAAKSEQRIEQLSDRVEEAVLDARRPVIGGADTPKAVKLPREWDDHLRKGHTHGLEEKSLSAGSNPEGGSRYYHVVMLFVARLLMYEGG